MHFNGYLIHSVDIIAYTSGFKEYYCPLVAATIVSMARMSNHLAYSSFDGTRHAILWCSPIGIPLELQHCCRIQYDINKEMAIYDLVAIDSWCKLPIITRWAKNAEQSNHAMLIIYHMANALWEVKAMRNTGNEFRVLWYQNRRRKNYSTW